jgi:hypothetical protein
MPLGWHDRQWWNCETAILGVGCLLAVYKHAFALPTGLLYCSFPFSCYFLSFMACSPHTHHLLLLVTCLQDWNAQQKEKRERLLAGWKPEDEEDGEKEGSGEHIIQHASPIKRLLIVLLGVVKLQCILLCSFLAPFRLLQLSQSLTCQLTSLPTPCYR